MPFISSSDSHEFFIYIEVKRFFIIKKIIEFNFIKIKFVINLYLIENLSEICREGVRRKSLGKIFLWKLLGKLSRRFSEEILDTRMVIRIPWESFLRQDFRQILVPNETVPTTKICGGSLRKSISDGFRHLE